MRTKFIIYSNDDADADARTKKQSTNIPNVHFEEQGIRRTRNKNVPFYSWID